MVNFSYHERKYLTIILEDYSRKRKTRWGNLYDEGLSKNNIHNITKKFLKEGYIIKEENYYLINKEKIPEIKKLLEQTIKEEQEQHRTWQEIFKQYTPIIGVILIFGILLITANILGIKPTDQGIIPNNTNNITENKTESNTNKIINLTTNYFENTSFPISSNLSSLG